MKDAHYIYNVATEA